MRTRLSSSTRVFSGGEFCTTDLRSRPRPCVELVVEDLEKLSVVLLSDTETWTCFLLQVWGEVAGEPLETSTVERLF